MIHQPSRFKNMDYGSDDDGNGKGNIIYEVEFGDGDGVFIQRTCLKE